MFSIDQIKKAHAKVKSGADFPAYIHELILLGVTGYDTYVTDGHTDFRGDNGFTISSEPKYGRLKIAEKSDPAKFIQDLQAHQEGKSGYLAFCEQAADTGIEKWVVDTNDMTCIYYDKAGTRVLGEKIPA